MSEVRDSQSAATAVAGLRLRVLIVGGSGQFGSRLARLLAREPALDIVIAGRSRAKAEAAAERISGAARISAAAFDRNGDVASLLAEIAPDLVVDASGPFQAYGADPYRLARAVITQGAHYIDLADGSAFVRGFAALDAEAKARGVFALSGASSAPALTAAVVRRLAADFASVESVTAGIAPSPHAVMGESVVGAVLSVAGRPVARRKGGATGEGMALVESRRLTVRPPGEVPLPRLRYSLVDTPDLTLLPELWPELRDVWFGAGIRPRLVHRLLTALAWASGRGLLPPLANFVRPMHTIHARIRWGEARSGMVVAVTGRTQDGLAAARSWHVTAEGDDGPFIPAMAAAAIVRKLIAGAPPPPGARAALRDVELEDYEREFEGFAIRSGVRDELEDRQPSRPLYARVLGSAWDRLPPEVRAVHDVLGQAEAAGRASVERGTGPLARLAAWLVGFPPSSSDVGVYVRFFASGGAETWARDFDGARFGSVQHEGRGSAEGLLVERFGLLALEMALRVEDGRLVLVPRRWRICGVPIPGLLMPRVEAHERVEDGRFRFDVLIRDPLGGLIVRYGGWLEPVERPGRSRVSEPTATP